MPFQSAPISRNFCPQERFSFKKTSRHYGKKTHVCSLRKWKQEKKGRPSVALAYGLKLGIESDWRWSAFAKGNQINIENEEYWSEIWKIWRSTRTVTDESECRFLSRPRPFCQRWWPRTPSLWKVRPLICGARADFAMLAQCVFLSFELLSVLFFSSFPFFFPNGTYDRVACLISDACLSPDSKKKKNVSCGAKVTGES